MPSYTGVVKEIFIGYTGIGTMCCVHVQTDTTTGLVPLWSTQTYPPEELRKHDQYLMLCRDSLLNHRTITIGYDGNAPFLDSVQLVV